MVKGIIDAFDHMEFCLFINLTNNWAGQVKKLDLGFQDLGYGITRMYLRFNLTEQLNENMISSYRAGFLS